MVPALQLLSATDVIRKRDITAPLAEQLGLTDEARLAEYESGNGNIFEDRTSWALSYLSLSGLADKPKRGFYRLSETGRELLQRPERVEAYVAERLAARDRQRQAEQAEAAPPGTVQKDAAADVAEATAQTPLEELVIASGEIRDAVSQEILDTILSKTPDAFERLVLALLSKLGYGGEIDDAAEQTARSRDGGIDGVIRQDFLGLGRIHVQAKRYAPDQAISRPAVQGFIGALASARGNKGVFITTSRFTPDAVEMRPKSEQRLHRPHRRRPAEPTDLRPRAGDAGRATHRVEEARQRVLGRIPRRSRHGRLTVCDGFMTASTPFTPRSCDAARAFALPPGVLPLRGSPASPEIGLRVSPASGNRGRDGVGSIHPCLLFSVPSVTSVTSLTKRSAARTTAAPQPRTVGRNDRKRRRSAASRRAREGCKGCKVPGPWQPAESIMTKNDLRDAMSSVYAKTLQFTRDHPGEIRESGGFFRLNAATGKYVCDDINPGPFVDITGGSTSRVGITVIKPGGFDHGFDNSFSSRSKPSYYVAMFHTHPPLPERHDLTDEHGQFGKVWREIGPSPETGRMRRIGKPRASSTTTSE